MIFRQIMNDPGLCAVSALLLVFWAWARFGPASRKTGPTNGEIAAVTLLRVVCGLILFYSTHDKLVEPSAFIQEVADYHTLPPQLVPLAAIVIPWVEFFSGAALVLGIGWRGAVVIFCGLMAVYSLSISWAFVRGIEIGCGCGLGDPNEKITWLTIVRDLLFLGMGLVVLFAKNTFAQLDRFFKKQS